jgi:hypothetical protein
MYENFYGAFHCFDGNGVFYSDPIFFGNEPTTEINQPRENQRKVIMQTLTQEHMEMLKLQAQIESQFVNQAHEHSKEFGEIVLSNAITDFKLEYLKPRYGDIIPSMSTEYRTFIIELLLGIDDRFKGDATAFVLMPKFLILTDDLIAALTKGDT